jgi:subtilisin family serine protease
MLENMNMKPSIFLGALALATILVACPPPPITVNITPSTTQSLGQGQVLNLTGAASNAANTGVTWSVAPNVGSLSSTTGNAITYTAPATITTDSNVTITATSIQDTSKLANLTIALKKPAIIVEPADGNGALISTQAAGEATIRSVAVATQVQFKATIQNATDQRVTWGIAEADAKFGTVDQSGNYTSPATVPSPAIATIRATSVATPSLFGDFQLTIIKSGGINGKVTLPEGLIPAPATGAAARASSLNVTIRDLKADWNAARVQKEVLVIASNTLTVQNLNSISPTLRAASSKTEAGFVRVQVPNGISDQAFAEKIARETGAAVQPNYKYRLLNAPNDTFFNDQSNLVQIDVAGAWAAQTSVPDGLIAILDTGINVSHPDLAGRIVLGKDFCPTYTAGTGAGTGCQGEDNDPSELSAGVVGTGHGTFATGLIAATTNNQAGIAGITQSGKILAVKVFGSEKVVTQGQPDQFFAVADTVSLSKGIKFADDQPSTKIISMSLGVCANETSSFDKTPDKLTENAIAAAVANGIVFVAASGNNGATGCGTDRGVQFPANNPNVIAVGSVNSNNARSSFSAGGASLDLVAPGEGNAVANSATGEGLLSLRFDNNAYEKRLGTSFAAPQVSAVAGLMLAKNPALTRVQIQSILESTAKDLGAAGKDDQFGAGLLQAGAALAKAAPASVIPQVKTSIYMYADRLLDVPNTTNCKTIAATNPDCYDGASGDAGRGVVTINGVNGLVDYSITLSRNGTALKAGKYRVVACVNKNSNAIACDSGDLGVASALNLDFNGTNLPNINLTLAVIP